MKAVRVRSFGGPEVLRVDDVPAPEPGAGHLVVSVKAIGVNPVEAYIRAGSYPRKPELPYVPGTDAAGVVESAGAGTDGLRPGDRVYIYATGGAYAEKVRVERSRVFPLPAALSFEQGAALGVPYATAHRALFHHGGAKRGETVLIHGASGGAVMMKDLAIHGMSLWNMNDAERAEVHADLGRGLADGSLKPAVGENFPLAEAAKAHEAVLSTGTRGKIVLIP